VVGLIGPIVFGGTVYSPVPREGDIVQIKPDFVGADLYWFCHDVIYLGS
jgi:hypothetical protein